MKLPYFNKKIVTCTLFNKVSTFILVLEGLKSSCCL